VGFGPLAPPPAFDDPASFAGSPAPAPTGWLRFGTGFGIPAAWILASLLFIPLAVYIVSYIPWAAPQHQETDASGQLPVLFCIHGEDQYDYCPTGQGWPSGHTGQTLWGLTQGMYAYHNDLRQPHAASSPWWAWPLDLKPVWFESISYSPDEGSMIYDGGNPALWWVAIPAFAFVCWQAFKRRSLGLTLITVAFFWQWISWVRIDRASFQYHFYTALPFFLLGLAYFIAELWHGPSRRTWLLARVAAAGALLFAPLLWLAKQPLCGLARVDLNDPAGYRQTACGATVGDLPVDLKTVAIVAILLVALLALALVWYRLESRQSEGQDEDRWWLVELVAPVVVAGALMLWAGRALPSGSLFHLYVPPGPPALVALILMSVLALYVLSVRDPRRFVLGFCVVAVVVFIALYPNLSAMPMPGNIASIYNGFLPTWLYGFQFSVNQQESVPVKLLDQNSLMFAGVALVVAGVSAYAAWVHRVIVGYRHHQDVISDGDQGGDAGSGPPGPSA
jgi:hypothetical protein